MADTLKLTHMRKLARMQSLIKSLNAASALYYGSGASLMSDHEWDALYDELKTLEAETGIILSNSPTQNVGGDLIPSTFVKTAHEISVKSLDKTKDLDALKTFLGNRPGILSWKLDGLTVVLTYDHGRLEKAVTRGKNGTGELITENAKQFLNVPLFIPYEGRLHVRGEALISYRDFEDVNMSLPEGELPYANPRNLAAGSVRLQEPSEVRRRHVTFLAFSSSHEEITHGEEFDWLTAQGFMVVGHDLIEDGDSLEDAVFQFKMKLPENPFPTDGLVLQFNDTAYGKSLGETDKFPRDAIAFKWQDEEKETTLKEIFWSPSRTGLINPVAIFEPVELEGTTVERASVHNVSILERLSLTPGDTIAVYKANMIIPQVSENKTMSGTPVIPDTCPACGGKTEIHTGRDGSRQLYCINPDCPAKHLGGFVHAVKRDALNIEGISEKTLEDFMAEGFLHTLGDLYRLVYHENEIAALPGYGRLSAANLKRSLETARVQTLDRLIYAFGIPFVGRTATKAICRHFGYDVGRTVNASWEELTAIDGVGEAIAQSFVSWFENPLHQEEFEDLLSEVSLIVPEILSQGKSSGIAGKTFVITGAVHTFPNRNALKAWIEDHGGKLAGSVSSKTDYLVTNAPDSGTSKNRDARRLGVPVITEKELRAMV